MKFYKKHRDNRGLTLIELVVAVAISVIAVGAIWQFILVSTRAYESQKAESELQQEVQQTMNQMQNLLIDTNRAVAYYYEDGADYVQLSSDYDAPKDASKRLEIYNDNTAAHLVWDKDEQEIIYKETTKDKAESTSDTDWESAVLAEGVEELAVDVSQVEEKQVLKLKLSFIRNDKTYTATRSIAMRNSIITTGDVDDIYGEETTVIKPMIVIKAVDNNILYRRDSHTFEATVSNSDDKVILWTIQGQTSEDTYMNITTGEIVIGALEKADQITVIATLESDRTVNSIYRFAVGDPTAPTVEIKDERGDGAKGEDIDPPIDTEELIINALCGEEYKIPILADIKPAEYSHKWTFIPCTNGAAVDAEIIVKRDSTGGLQEYLVVGENQTEDFWLRADVVSNEANNGSDLCYVNVIPPVPEIQVQYEEEVDGNVQTKTAYEDVTLYGGTNVEISALWTSSIATEEHPFGYSENIFNEHDIEWTITALNGTEVVEVTKDVQDADGVVKAFTQVPFYGADSIEITAVSQKYTNVTFPKITITLKKPELTLYTYQLEEVTEITSSGETKTVVNQIPVTEDMELEFYKQVQLVPEYVGGRVDNLEWTVTLKNRVTDEVTGPIVINKIDEDGTVTWNTATTKFNGQNMVGKEVTVTVREKEASDSVQASATFKVKCAKECDLKVNEGNGLDTILNKPEANVKKYDYLQLGYDFKSNFDKLNSTKAGKAEDYIGNYAFLSSIDYEGDIAISSYYIQNMNSGLMDTSQLNYIMKATIKNDNSILFKPQIPASTTNINDIKSIVYDIDDKNTGEHVCFIKLDMTVANYYAAKSIQSGRGTSMIAYVAYYSPIPNEKLTQTTESEEMKFCNYYGWDVMSEKNASLDYADLSPVMYKCVYKEEGFLFWKKWYIYIYDNGNKEYEYKGTYS